MEFQIEYVITVVILWIMAWLMRIRKLDILIARYASFQNIIRRKSFSVDKQGVARYYSNLFIVSGFEVIFYMLFYDNAYGRWAVIVLFSILLGSIVYLNTTQRYLNFENNRQSSNQRI